MRLPIHADENTSTYLLGQKVKLLVFTEFISKLTKLMGKSVEGRVLSFCAVSVGRSCQPKKRGVV